MRASEFLTELRDRMFQYIKSLLPTWPDYVLKDWVYGLARGDHQAGVYFKPDADFGRWGFNRETVFKMIADAGLSPDTKWQLIPNMKFTMNMFEPNSKRKLIGRAGGSSDMGMGIPKDAERHATQAALAQQQGGIRKEPVILIKTPQGYELLEGWHRTIQHFAQYPDGYVGPAYVAVAQSKPGITESMAADQVLDYVNRLHHDFDIEYSITDHPEWELKNIPLRQLHLDPDGEEQDPYNRVNWVDYDKVRDLIPKIGSVLKSSPIVVDSQGWIIDGNHRAMAAAEAGLTSVSALVPVKQHMAEGTEQKPVVIYTNHRGATIDDDIKKSLRTTQEPFNKLQMWEKHKSMKDPKIADWVTNKLLPELKQNGVLKPLLVWNNNGQLFVIDGNHRFIAYQEAGYRGRVPVQIVPDNMITISDTVPGQQGVAEDTELSGDFNLSGQNLFLKNLAQNLKQRYPDATVKLSSDRVTAYHDEGNDEALTVMGGEVMDSGYIGVGLDDAFTESFQGVLVPTIKQTTEQLLAANPGTRPALFLSTDNWNPDAWTHIASKLGYRLVADDESLDEGINIGQEWMSDTELDQYMPDQLQQQWRELLGYDRNGNPSALWTNLTGGYEPDVRDPEHRALMVKVANKWFAAKKIPNVKFYDVKDADDELEWLVQIGSQDMAENFADGRNPGRKGLAKRSGVNTKASVSSLRKTAKNSSGEKQRMAHWLANMKAGRAKARKK